MYYTFNIVSTSYLGGRVCRPSVDNVQKKEKGSKKGEKYHQGKNYLDGFFYKGELKDGIRHGKGTQIHPYGWKYKGEWKGGLFHGQGTYTWSNGEKYVGEWKDGERWNGTSYDQNEDIKTKYVNGKRTYQ